MSRRLGRRFFSRPSAEVAPELLNMVLVGRDGVAARIVEVEAYAGRDDGGSHARRGPTPRTTVMHGPPGHLYVYFSYGMHWCANVVTDVDGRAGAVLLRAATPLRGLARMRHRRGTVARRTHDLCSGPAKLCQAFAINGDDNGADLVTADRGLSVRHDGTSAPAHPVQTTRIGLSQGTEHPWRWFVRDSADVSVRTRHF